MRTVGLSVPDVVREIITRNRSIHDCMAMDVINYTALAVKIHPEVEKQIGNPIHLNTIVVAIKRYADAFEKNENVIDEPVLKDARLTMTDRISFIVHCIPIILSVIESLASFNTGSSMTFSSFSNTSAYRLIATTMVFR